MSPGIAPLTKRSVASVQNVAESGGATAKFTCRVDVLLSPSPEVVRCGGSVCNCLQCKTKLAAVQAVQKPAPCQVTAHDIGPL